MNTLVLKIFNHYVGGDHSFHEAAAYVADIPILPIPERITLNDWRVHVPMPLLESWEKLSDVERIVLYVMGQSATHPYECATDHDSPVMN